MLGFLYSLTLTSIHDYWKTIALARRIFVNKVMYLLLNRLSRLAIDFLPNSKGLLISQLQTTSAVILESKKIKFLICVHLILTLLWLPLLLHLPGKPLEKVLWLLLSILGTPNPRDH